MTIEIQLTKGHIAIIDDVDADLTDMKWHPRVNKRSSTVYAANSKGTLHQVVFERMTGKRLVGNRLVIDHINRNGLDNRRENLRLATNGQNIVNKPMKPGRSGIRGVQKTPSGKWTAKISADHLGTFNTAEEAKVAFIKAAKERWGDFYTPDES